MILPALEGTRLKGKLALHLLPQVAVADATAIVLLPLTVDPASAVRAGFGALVTVVAVSAVTRPVVRRIRAQAEHEDAGSASA